MISHISMGFQQVSVEFQKDFYGIAMGSQWGFYWMGFFWDLYDIPGGFLWDSYRNSMIFYWISMTFLWGYYGGSMGSGGGSIVCLWYFYGIAMGCLLDFHGVSLEFL